MEMIIKNSVSRVVAIGISFLTILTAAIGLFSEINTASYEVMGCALILLNLVVSMGITMILNITANKD